MYDAIRFAWVKVVVVFSCSTSEIQKGVSRFVVQEPSFGPDGDYEIAQRFVFELAVGVTLHAVR